MSTHETSSTSDTPPFRYTAGLAGQIESRWQSTWAERGTYRAGNPGEPGFQADRPKFFCLDMFPYPSGAGLHVGHPEGYTATDIISRYKRMKGYNVLHPMGWDAFGLPAEQYAIQTGVHPAITTKKAIDTFRRQLQRFGFSYDWSREFATIDPDYYRWTQWIFLQIYNSWYDTTDPSAPGRARPIAELIAGLESGEFAVNPFGDIVAINARPAAIFGEPVGVKRWHELSPEERRGVIDGQRLAYLGEQTVNWCPKLGTALANEEVIDGRSERGGFPVFRKPLKQWMFRITAYAQRLLDDLKFVDWPASTKAMQAEWIGKSEGAEIDFALADTPGTEAQPSVAALTVYTTRPDTIFGATYMVIAPEHPLVDEILQGPMTVEPGTSVDAIGKYVLAARNRSDVERQAETKTKTGVFSGLYAINPATGKRIPIWIADYVLMGYGTGAIMAVPAQDQRDWDFAKAFDLPIVRTVRPPEGWEGEAFVGDGPAMNSSSASVSLDGLGVAEAKSRMIEWLEREGVGRRKVNFRLRDWLFSRQRYWGEPFPIVFDERGNHHPVSEAALPVRLPELADYQPIESDDPAPLLAKATAWAQTTAGAAGVAADVLPPGAPVMRETNTMPGWAGSCWYYLRYCDPKNSGAFVSREAERYWMAGGGVDLYIGGAEHAVLHLLYARFWHKVLFDLGHVSSPEPFSKLFHQGLITSFSYQRHDTKALVPVDRVFIARWKREYVRSDVSTVTDSEWEFFDLDGNPIQQPVKLKNDVQGRANHLAPNYEVHVEIDSGKPLKLIEAKMSKSLKNVVNPDDVIAEYGADTFRLYEMYMGPLEASKPWNPRDIVGCFRFLQRAWRLMVDESSGALRTAEAPDDKVERELHRLIKKVGEDIDRLAFNTAIAAMISFVNEAGQGPLTRDQVERFCLVLAPFCPHMAEEVWAKLGKAGSIATAPWPSFDASRLVADQIEIPVQVGGKVRGRVMVPAGADAKAMEAAALAEPKVQEAIAGKSIKKVIVIPGKMVNIVAG